MHNNQRKNIIDDVPLWHFQKENPGAEFAPKLVGLSGGRLGIFLRPQKFCWPCMLEVGANSAAAIGIFSSIHLHFRAAHFRSTLI